jgi:GH35 family endo-1,4-beta-xylanase
MKSILKIKLLTLLLILSNGMLFAQIPAGGISLIKETYPNFTKGGGKGTLTNTTITGQTFTKGFKYVTGADISNTWDGQVTFAKTVGIEADDVLLITFYARTLASVQEFGEGSVIVCIEDNKTYEKQTYYKVAIGSEWKQYFVPVKCKSTLAFAAVTYSFHTGFISQSVEFADVKYMNYKKTLTLEQLPVTPITYIGREANAAWRAEADERINQIRKGIADVVVYDEQGQIVKDATVTIEMEKHKFGFGSAIAGSRFMTDALYRNKVYELFNEVVLENDLKWPSFNPNPSVNTKKTLDSMAFHKIPVRGHTMVWPSFTYNLASLKTLSTNPVAFRNEIDRHIDQVAQFAKGKVIDWDVLNEPYTNKEFMAILGDEVMADWFKRVRQNDREVKLYINDYSILSAGGMDINHQNGYFDIIKYIDSKGGKIEGIGMQSHFDNNLTPITKVYSILERFATLGKEIKITEHDINLNQRDVQADYTRDFMTIVFSHPSVKSFLTWGFWAKQHWLPEGAFYAEDWSIRPHGQAWLDLVFNEWWTKKANLTTDSEGKVSLDGFLGTYKYTIKNGDKIRTGTFKIDHSKQSGLTNPVVLSFDNTIPDHVSITTTKSACLCEGENVTLQATIGTDLTYQWLKGTDELPEQTSAIVANQSGIYTVKVKKGTVEMTSTPIEVKVTPVPQVPAITATGDLAFCPDEKVNFSTVASNDLTYSWYKGTTKIQGSVTSLDVNQSGSYSLQVNAYGCSAKSEPVTVQVYSSTSTECTTGLNPNQKSIQIYPNPFKGEFTLETSQLNHGPITLELFNASGARVYFQEIDQISGKTIIPVANPGFYTLRISTKDSVQTFKVVGN